MEWSHHLVHALNKYKNRFLISLSLSVSHSHTNTHKHTHTPHIHIHIYIVYCTTYTLHLLQVGAHIRCICYPTRTLHTSHTTLSFCLCDSLSTHTHTRTINIHLSVSLSLSLTYMHTHIIFPHTFINQNFSFPSLTHTPYENTHAQVQRTCEALRKYNFTGTQLCKCMSVSICICRARSHVISLSLSLCVCV